MIFYKNMVCQSIDILTSDGEQIFVRPGDIISIAVDSSNLLGDRFVVTVLSIESHKQGHHPQVCSCNVCFVCVV